MKRFSQNNEQEVLAEVLAGTPNGHLLDIGAYVPDTFSNTRSLIDAGWTAVLVEPSPVPFTALLNHYGGNPKVQLVNAAIVPKAVGWASFYDSAGDAISSCSAEHRDRWEAGYNVKFREYALFPVGMGDLLARYGLGFDFINLDVESLNLELFNAIPFLMLPKLKAICVEHDGHVDYMTGFLSGLGFKPVLVNGENLILSR